MEDSGYDLLAGIAALRLGEIALLSHFHEERLIVVVDHITWTASLHSSKFGFRICHLFTVFGEKGGHFLGLLGVAPTAVFSVTGIGGEDQVKLFQGGVIRPANHEKASAGAFDLELFTEMIAVDALFQILRLGCRRQQGEIVRLG